MAARRSRPKPVHDAAVATLAGGARKCPAGDSPMRRLALGFAVAATALLSAQVVLAQGAERAYIPCDNGVRCVRQPCEHTSAREIGSRAVTRLYRVDISRLSPEERNRENLGPDLYNGRLVVRGRIDTATRTLIASRIERATRREERAHCSPAR
jgi:hypothetical protein